MTGSEKRQCVIFCALPVSASLQRHIRQGAYLMAADAGYLQAQKLGRVPDVILGDFDSAPVPAFSGECIRLPAEKDDTDTHYAVKRAVEKGFQDILLLGALGARADHSFANLQTLLYIARHGARGTAVSEKTEIVCLPPKDVLRLPHREAWVSVFAAGGETRGVSLKGLKYPLEDAVLTPEFPVGTSNEFAGTQAEISCQSGYLYVMVSPKE